MDSSIGAAQVTLRRSIDITKFQKPPVPQKVYSYLTQRKKIVLSGATEPSHMLRGTQFISENQFTLRRASQQPPGPQEERSCTFIPLNFDAINSDNHTVVSSARSGAGCRDAPGVSLVFKEINNTYQTPVKAGKGESPNKYVGGSGTDGKKDKWIDGENNPNQFEEANAAQGGSPGRLPGLMRSKQSVFDRFSEKQDLIREVHALRT